ncbi:unnamed protein product [Rotaria sordida]|uniref:Kinesin light chain n=1 Tax=Rotaria sordida TaxID=392033 RepID=A0A819YMV5_9BILA|nr:unnamed protein product [Rotaria sordida]CAF4160162.1 unnamed protein product [Rotaria sordida]
MFTDADQCVDFLSDINDGKVFMIVSGAVQLQIILEIQACPQLDSIYVYCDDQLIHEHWAIKIPKVKGVYTQIQSICEELQIDRVHCDRSMIPISFNGIDPLFMYTQLLKETLLEIEDDDRTSIKELVDYCRLQDAAPDKKLEKIEREYRHHTPIWWYTGPYFIYSMLNYGLRLMDVNIILKMGFFIQHLHQHIEQLHREQQFGKTTAPFKVFRGQGLSMEDFNKMKQTEGGLMSFNNFLSTSRQRHISLDYSWLALSNANSVGILFVMTIDPTICEKSKIPFVDVSKGGFFEDTEEEVLFTTHTIFRINQITRIEDNDIDRLWQVNLTLTGNNDHDLNTLTSYLYQDFNWTTGWSRLGAILIQLGEHEKAELLYKILLETASSDKNHADYNLQIGTMYYNISEYSKALSSYERSVEINKIALPQNHPDLATSYNNIGNVYYNMGEYSQALTSYERSLEIRKIALPLNHPRLAGSYNNIGNVYVNIGEYSKALSSYERSVEIREIALPPNHLDLATSYNNIGNVYYNMDEYSQALTFYERSLEIRKIALPPNHPRLAGSYNNIGNVYVNIGKYSKALSSYERSVEIRKISLPPNHPDLAASYNNIGSVYYNMGEYSQALTSYERSLEIRKIALPPNHPHLAGSYNNIGNVYVNIGEYLKALSYYKQAQEIWQKSLPPANRHIVGVKRNIENVKKKL